MKHVQNIRLAVDAIVFAYNKDNGISLLLIQRKYDPYKNSWALPGGFVRDDESLEMAVSRELNEECGINPNYLEQLYTFGEVKRDPRQRIVSVAYYGLVNQADFATLKSSTDAQDARWFNIYDLPPLAFDHQKIADIAITRLRSKIKYEPIGFELLDNKFPFSDLEHLYSCVLNEDLDRRNFKKKFIKLGILNELNEIAPKSGAGRPGKLYEFNLESYLNLKHQGMHFEV